jgi:hypothetical protein
MAIYQEFEREVFDPVSRDFCRAASYADHRYVVIRTSCKHCGASAFVSIADGSASQWEFRHRCESPNDLEAPLKRVEKRRAPQLETALRDERQRRNAR